MWIILFMNKSTDLLIIFPKHTISHSSLWRVNLVKSIKGSPPLRFCFPKGRLFFHSANFSLFVVTARWKGKTHSHFLTYTSDNNFEGGERRAELNFYGKSTFFFVVCWHQTDRHPPWRAERHTSRFPPRSQNFRNDFLTTLERRRRRQKRENRRCDMMRGEKKVAAGQKVEIRQLVFLRLQKLFAHKTDNS